MKKATEKSAVTQLLNLTNQDPKWEGVIEDAFHAETYFVRFKGKELQYAAKPISHGRIYVKCKMDPDIADDFEEMFGTYVFEKTDFYGVELVFPLSENEGKIIEALKAQPPEQLSPELQRLRKDEYVTIIKGTYKGKYGVLRGAKKGKLEVRE